MLRAGRPHSGRAGGALNCSPASSSRRCSSASSSAAVKQKSRPLVRLLLANFVNVGKERAPETFHKSHSHVVIKSP